ncbi:MAG: LysR family transcriptional regulator [Dialister invisus]
MKLTLLALTYFQKTAELQHLTHAAEALHISQPSLSHTIKMLEQELGVPLFRRSGRNIVLTKYGEILLSHTNRIMSELACAERAGRRQRSTGHDGDDFHFRRIHDYSGIPYRI